MLIPTACCGWPAERHKLRKYFINDKKTTNKTLWIMNFKPFSPETYLFIMTLRVSIEQCEKLYLLKPNRPQRQKHRFMSHSPYCPVARLNGPRAYIRTPLYKLYGKGYCSFTKSRHFIDVIVNEEVGIERSILTKRRLCYLMVTSGFDARRVDHFSFSPKILTGRRRE